MKHITGCALGAWIIFGALDARADFVVLADGERIEGVVTERGDEVIVQLDFGTLSIAKADVASIERAPSALSALEAKRSKLAAGDVEGLYRLALEAEKSGLSARSRGLFREVLDAAPEHKGARAALGYRKHEGRWLTEDDFMRSRGYVQHGGQWVTADAAAALERAELERRAQAVEERRQDDQRERIARLEREVAEARIAAARAERGAALSDDLSYAYVPVWGPAGYTVERVNQSGSLTISIGGGAHRHGRSPQVHAPVTPAPVQPAARPRSTTSRRVR